MVSSTKWFPSTLSKSIFQSKFSAAFLPGKPSSRTAARQPSPLSVTCSCSSKPTWTSQLFVLDRWKVKHTLALTLPICVNGSPFTLAATRLTPLQPAAAHSPTNRVFLLDLNRVGHGAPWVGLNEQTNE